MKISVSLFCLSLVFLGSCNMAPKYERPDLALPSSWRIEEEVGDTLANASWWKALGDEVLDQLIETALLGNKDLQVAVFRVYQYLGQFQAATSSLYPQMNANSKALKSKFAVDDNFLPQGSSPITPDFGLNLSLSYEIDFWGKARNESAAAFSEYLASIENRKTVVLTLIGAVVQGYIYLRQLDTQLELSKSILGSRKESLDIAKYRFEGGLTSEIEVDQALSVYEEAAAKVFNYIKLIGQQENLLSALLGKSPGPIPRGKSLQDLILPKEVPSGLPSDLLTRRPDIVRAENILKASNANIGVARAAFFPQLSFGALYGVDSLALKTLVKKTSRTWLIGGSLLDNIFTGGLLTGQLKIAEAEKKEMVFTYEQTVLTALKEVDDALIGLKQSKEVFAADQRELAALKGYLQLAWYRYYEGETEYLTVLDAERKVFDSALNVVTAQADQFLNLVDLYKSLGGGWVEESDQVLMAHEKP